LCASSTFATSSVVIVNMMFLQVIVSPSTNLITVYIIKCHTLIFPKIFKI